MRRTVSPLILCSLAAALLAAPAAIAQKRRVALISYGAAAAELEPALRSALRTLSTVALADRESTRADVAAAAELGAVCGATSRECLVKLAVLLAVETLVVSSAEHGADGSALELLAIDPALGREGGRERALIPRGAGRGESVRDIVQLLLEPHLHYGSLVVASELPGTSLAVDGQRRAETPYPRAVLRLRAGKHHVEVARAGYASFTAEAKVTAGTEATVAAQLVPTPAEPLVTASVVVATTGLATAAIAGAVAGAIDLGLQGGLGTAEEKAGYHDAGVVAYVVAGAGAAVAVAGGIVALVAHDAEKTPASP
jgi:hypothetical protein